MIDTPRIGSIFRNVATAFALCAAAASQAQVVAPAVPEFVELTEAEQQTPAGAELAAAQEAFRTSLDRQPERALELAKDIVALTAETFGDDSAQLSYALTNLAIVQAENTNYAAAVENYAAALRVREQADNSIVAPELVNPLRGLASAYMALNEIERAIPIYERAIHITHVNEGPNNLEQVEVMDALSRAYYFLGARDEASDIQDNIFRLQQRQLSEDSDQYVDALLRRARWYTRVQDFNEASRAYRRVERTLTDAYGADDIRLIEPLIDFAFVVPRRENDAPGLTAESNFNEGRRAIARAARIAREHSDTRPELLPLTLVKQGDWLMFASMTRAARMPYREAWELLDADPSLHELRDQIFSRPEPITRVAMRNLHGLLPGEEPDRRSFPQRGFVDVRFDVNPLGRPVNVEITGGEPPGLLDGHVRRQLRRFVFRPAFSDGDPVTYEGAAFRHLYRYNESRLTDREREYIEAARAEREAAGPADGEDRPPAFTIGGEDEARVIELADDDLAGDDFDTPVTDEALPPDAADDAPVPVDDPIDDVDDGT